METKIIQITSGRGPAECCLAVAFALKEIIGEIKGTQLEYEVIERSKGPENGTLSSAAILIKGKGAGAFAESWSGVLLWIAQSPYRKFHKRKNWYIGIHCVNPSAFAEVQERDVMYQTMRASGPGGQNVNKVESAVRATHIPSGIQVVVNESRSQYQNKKIATERLKEQYEKWILNQLQEKQQAQWQNHNNLERGNPKRTYYGATFIKQN
jgi:peptide chain release factor